MADLATALQDAPAPVGAADHGQDLVPRPPAAVTPVAQTPGEDVLERAKELLATHPVVDGFNGLPWVLRVRSGHEPTPARFDLDIGEAGLQTDLPRLRAGRVGAQFWSVSVLDGSAGDRLVSTTLEQIELAHAVIRAYPESLRLALTADDVIEAHKRGRVASLLAADGGQAINCSLGTLRALFTLGVRRMALTQGRGTPWADGTEDQHGAGGLTVFGEEVVREMNRLGMLVDLSHSSVATMRRALTVSKAPVVFARSAARAVTDHPAGVPDDVLSLMASGGGVCMVSFEATYVRGSGPATVADVADHLDHVRRVAGPDHVGLAGSYDTDDGSAARPAGLEDAAGYPRLIAELLERGWSTEDLTKLTWRNMLRVLRDVEFTARAAQARRGPSTATMARLDGHSAYRMFRNLPGVD